MTEHPSEDDLVLHFYGEASLEDEAVVAAHLEACPSCMAVWQELADTLKLVDAARVPEPDASFEERTWARVQPALHQASGGASVLPFRFPQRLAMPAAVAAAAAVVLAVTLAGRQWRTATLPSTAPAVATVRAPLNAAAHERVLLTALDEQFQRSEMLLVEVMNASQASELQFERQTADDLLASGRLYRQTAQQNGNVRLAQMLEDLELVLVEIARRPDRVNHTDLNALRTRIEDEDLVFKVRAVSKQIEDRQKNLATE